MFRLSKYELRKNRTALFVLLAGLAALQICFLIALRGKTQDYAIIWSTILVLYAVVCYFAVFIFAITNYYREINSKTSYLVFMTPVSALSIILSKMLTVLVLYQFQSFSLPLKSPHPCFYTRNIDLKTVKNQAIPVHQALPLISLLAQEQSASLTILWKEHSQAS